MAWPDSEQHMSEQQLPELQQYASQQAAPQQEPEQEAEIVPVEIALRPGAPAAHVQAAVEAYINGNSLWYREAQHALPPELQQHCVELRVCDAIDTSKLLYWQVQPQLHLYTLADEDEFDEEEDEEGGTSSYREWQLPSRAFDGLWESLVFSSAVKRQLLTYAHSALLFAARNVDPQLVTWNRVVLLHGPPGTGKTSLCKALAHKLAIRLGSRYSQSALVEVNSHSLFSKFFSESGKLVARLFTQVRELLEDPEQLVFVLIDEVESLTAARRVGGSEPADALRAVNALLTQLDSLKRYPNAMVLCTTNLTGAIDVAFLDRADIKAYLGPPMLEARYQILRTCFLELQRAGIVQGGCSPCPFAEAFTSNFSDGLALSGAAQQQAGGDACSQQAPHLSQAAVGIADEVALSRALFDVAHACDGSSGRTLRKLPFLTHAQFFGGGSGAPVSPAAFVAAMRQCAATQAAERQRMTGNHV